MGRKDSGASKEKAAAEAPLISELCRVCAGARGYPPFLNSALITQWISLNIKTKVWACLCQC